MALNNNLSINEDGPGSEGTFADDGLMTTLINGVFTANPGQVPNNKGNAASFEADDQIEYKSVYGDWSTVGQGMRAHHQPAVPILAMHLHPEFDGGKLDTDSFGSTVGLGAGPAPGDAEEVQLPQQATFGMKGGNGKMKGPSLASSGKPKGPSSGKPRGTRMGLGPMGSGPQRNVTA